MQVPLGVILKNENKNRKMVEIVEELQSYVPVKTRTHCSTLSTGEVEYQEASIHRILMGGDQLVAKRGRGEQHIKMNGIVTACHN